MHGTSSPEQRVQEIFSGSMGSGDKDVNASIPIETGREGLRPGQRKITGGMNDIPQLRSETESEAIGQVQAPLKRRGTRQGGKLLKAAGAKQAESNVMTS